VYITGLEGKKLFLEFDNEQVGRLAFLFGMLPLSVILLIIYFSSWIAYRFSSQAVSPIIQLAKDVEQLDPSSQEFSNTIKQSLKYSRNREVTSLADALNGLTERIGLFLERERNFTRDASHELRSPITVIKMACELLLNDRDFSKNSRKQIARIQRNANDMEELIETLLLLARESDHLLSSQNISINDIVREEIERAETLMDNKNIKITVNENHQLIIKAPDKVLSVMIGNIIRNAFSYTDEGEIRISIDHEGLIIEDSGIGISDEQLENIYTAFERGKQRGGYGVGLTIVKMLSDRYNWPIQIDSELNVGTRVSIQFPGAI
ncbi:MAG: HAMP domain-containing histidine kinase, partial [Gammaproteobacteria bacterium]|nr:HAMP domain-containing histidine kinase [Gammaproteobacteria bacterium]